MRRARAFVFPYGAHRGRTVGDLAAAGAEGLRYVQYAAREWSGNAAKACRIVLGLDQPDPSDAR
jgi:hypothetical protein